MKKRQSLFSSCLVWLPLFRVSRIPASRIDISKTEQQKNERKKRLFCSLCWMKMFDRLARTLDLNLLCYKKLLRYRQVTDSLPTDHRALTDSRPKNVRHWPTVSRQKADQQSTTGGSGELFITNTRNSTQRTNQEYQEMLKVYHNRKLK